MTFEERAILQTRKFYADQGENLDYLPDKTIKRLNAYTTIALRLAWEDFLNDIVSEGTAMLNKIKHWFKRKYNLSP